MKKQYFKCALAIFTAIMTVLTVLILPAGAKSAEIDVQTWDFKGLENIEVTKGKTFAQQVSKDGKIKIGACEANYNHGPLIINDGRVEMNYTETQSYSEWWYILLQFKLDNDLKAGKTYTFSTDFSINVNIYPKNFYFFYTKEEGWGDGHSNEIPKGSNTVVLDGSLEPFATKNNYTYTFTPENDLAAGGYLALRFNPTSATFNTTVSNAKITNDIPCAANEDLIIADDWDFKQFDNTEQQERLDTSYAKNPTLESKDNKIKIGACEDAYNICSLNITDGSVTISRTADYSWGDADYRYVLLQFKLDKTLKAGKSYTFNTDFTVKNSGKWPSDFYFFYTTQTGWGDGAAEPNATGTVVLDGKSGGFESKTNYAFTFIPETDLAAGGYLALRFNTKGAQFTATISNVELLTIPTENEVTNSSVTAGNKFAFDGAEFKTGSGYKLIVNYNAAADAVLKVYEGETEKILGTLKAANTSASLDYVCGNTSPEFIIEGTGITVSSVSAGEYIKALAPDSKIDDIKDENRLYTKIILPEINSELKTYYMVTNDGEIKLDGNVALNLDYDTEYTFVARYKDSYRFYANGDAVEAQKAVKTRKNGDVTGDDCVDIRDFVRLKNGLALSSENELYILSSSGADSLAYLRKVLLGVTD